VHGVRRGRISLTNVVAAAGDHVAIAAFAVVAAYHSAGGCYASPRLLAGDLGIATPKAAKRALGRAVAAGLISASRGERTSGATTYRPLEPDVDVLNEAVNVLGERVGTDRVVAAMSYLHAKTDWPWDATDVGGVVCLLGKGQN
jgi:hypothetical protein